MMIALAWWILRRLPTSGSTAAPARGLIAGALALALAAGSGVRAAAAESYWINDLGEGEAWAINAAGQVAGIGMSGAFLYDGVKTRTIADGVAYGINAAGRVVGSVRASRGSLHAFLYDNTGVHDLGTLGGGKYSGAQAVNNLGQVVGETDKGAFFYDRGVMQYIGSLGDGETIPRAINDAGQIVGVSTGGAFLLTPKDTDGDGKPDLWFEPDPGNPSRNRLMRDLGGLGGGNSAANGLNAAGHVVGSSQGTDGKTHAFLFDGTRMHDLGVVGPNGTATAINAAGQVVGTFTTSQGDQHAFLWENGKMYDLNSLMPSDAGGTLWIATDINDAGQICGMFYQEPRSGWGHALLLSPASMLPPLPPVPANLTVSGPTRESQITLTWAEPGSLATSVEVERRTPDTPFARIAIVNRPGRIGEIDPPAPEFADTGLSRGTTYIYRLRAVNRSGPSAYSAEVTGTTLPDLAALTLDRDSVVGGSVVVGTVTLSAPAPPESVPVTIAADNPAVVLSSPLVTLSRGQASATFVVRTTPVRAANTISFTATYRGTTLTTALTLLPSHPVELSLNPSRLIGGGNTQGTVVLNGKSPEGGSVVTLSAVNGAPITTPPSVTVPAGATTATFPVATQVVTSVTDVTITATCSGTSQTATLTVTPPAPPGAPSNLAVSASSHTSLTLSWTFNSRTTSTAATETRLEIERSAAGGSFERLASVDVQRTEFADIGLSPGAAYAYRARAVNAGGPSAYSNEARASTRPIALASVTLAPDRLTGGTTATGTVALDFPAPAGGAAVSLTNANMAVAFIPRSVMVPAGETSATFSVATQPVADVTTVGLQASYDGESRTARLTVMPSVTVASVSVSPDTVTGGRAVIGTVTLSAPAPAAGAEVALTSDNTASATVPPSVLVAPGTNAASFPVTTRAVTAAATVGVFASYAGTRQGATLTVLPPSEPPPAPSNLLVNSVSPTKIALSWVDNSATETGFEIERRGVDGEFRQIWAVGSDTTVFTDATVAPNTRYFYRVRAVNKAGVSDYSNEASGSTLPAAVTFVTVSPEVVTGGQSSLGMVTLNGPAPPEGATISLRSSSPESASVPERVIVPSGATWTTFAVSTSAVTTAVSVTLSAEYAGAAQIATLKLLPSSTSGTSREKTGEATKTRHIAVFRPSTREWFLRAEDGSVAIIPFGGPGDVPVAADYLGTGRPQIAVFRPSTREWFIRRDDGSAAKAAWGGPGDVPVPGDYFGLGRLQIAVYRPSTSEFFLRDDHGRPTRIQFGSAGDVPVPFDYSGVGRTQIGVYRVGTGEWFVRQDNGQAKRIPWGGPQDRPIPGAFR